MELGGIECPKERYHLYPWHFSGGMRQRSVMAIALASNPDILFADEPTTALDVTIQAQILDLLREIQKKLGTSTILVSHDLGVVARAADRVAVMYAGKIVEIGTAEEIYYDPRHPYNERRLWRNLRQESCAFAGALGKRFFWQMLSRKWWMIFFSTDRKPCQERPCGLGQFSICCRSITIFQAIPIWQSALGKCSASSFRRTLIIPPCIM